MNQTGTGQRVERRLQDEQNQEGCLSQNRAGRRVSAPLGLVGAITDLDCLRAEVLSPLTPPLILLGTLPGAQ